MKGYAFAIFLVLGNGFASIADAEKEIRDQGSRQDWGWQSNARAPPNHGLTTSPPSEVLPTRAPFLSSPGYPNRGDVAPTSFPNRKIDEARAKDKAVHDAKLPPQDRAVDASKAGVRPETAATKMPPPPPVKNVTVVNLPVKPNASKAPPGPAKPGGVRPGIVSAQKKTTGLRWWEIVLIALACLVGLTFACICCCALLESSEMQRQELRTPDGERIGFMQAPGRHIILIVDGGINRIRRGGTPQAASTTSPRAAPAQEGAAPHAPNVQPIYPKV